jgi:hypothetical protein
MQTTKEGMILLINAGLQHIHQKQPNKKYMQTGVELIEQERLRQIAFEGYTKDHDAQHESGELTFAAVCYATPFVLYEKKEYANSIQFEKASIDWNLDLPYDGNVLKDNRSLGNIYRIKQLVKAGALIAAEIDRLKSTN